MIFLKLKKKCVGLEQFRSQAFFGKKKRCDLGHQLCPGYKLLKKGSKKNKNKQEQKIYLSVEKPAHF